MELKISQDSQFIEILKLSNSLKEILNFYFLTDNARDLLFFCSFKLDGIKGRFELPFLNYFKNFYAFYRLLYQM